MGTPSAAIAAAHAVCAGWGLTDAETERLVVGEPARAAAVIRIAELLDGLYSGDLPAMWMTIPNRNPHLGTVEHSVRPIDYVLASPERLATVLRLLEGFAQGR